MKEDPNIIDFTKEAKSHIAPPSGPIAESAAALPEEELEEEKRQLPEFPSECLPPILANMAKAISELGRWPLRLTGPLVLAAASASLGRGIRVRSYDGHETRANTYLLIGKESGSGGTSAFRLAFAPIFGFQTMKRREFANGLKPILEGERATQEAEIEYLKRQARGKKSADERRQISKQISEVRKALRKLDEELAEPCFLTGDATPEGMTRLLAEHGETLCHADSDAADAISSILGRYSDGKDTATESLWLKAYGGEQVLVARKKDGLVLLEDPCLSVVFLVTPSKLSELFANPRLCEAGLLPRFCVVNPHCLPSKIPVDSNAEAKTLPSEASQPYEAAIFACFEHYRLELNDDPMVIDMERDARKLVIHYFNALVDAPHRGPFEARIAEQAIKFALIYHVFAHIKIERRSQGTYGVEDLDEELPPLDRLAMEAGLGISQWFARCQEEFLSKKRQGDRENVYHRFHQKFSKHPFFTTRELYSSGLDVNTAEEARKYFEDWESRGLIEQLRTEEKGGPGRRKLPHYRFPIMLRGKLA
jgi:hypothetical protein